MIRLICSPIYPDFRIFWIFNDVLPTRLELVIFAVLRRRHDHLDHGSESFTMNMLRIPRAIHGNCIPSSSSLNSKWDGLIVLISPYEQAQPILQVHSLYVWLWNYNSSEMFYSAIQRSRFAEVALTAVRKTRRIRFQCRCPGVVCAVRHKMKCEIL